MYFLYIVTGLALLISLIANREKTFRAVKVAARRFVGILPAFLVMIILVSIVLFLVPDEVITTYLGSESKFFGVLFEFFTVHINIFAGDRIGRSVPAGIIVSKIHIDKSKPISKSGLNE